MKAFQQIWFTPVEKGKMQQEDVLKRASSIADVVSFSPHS